MVQHEGDRSTIKIDKVRASKAGHAFHEAWAARTALELLPPATELKAITLEGFDEQDEQHLGAGAVEIADLVRYYGGTDVATARRVTVVQFKYSIASAETAVRAADLTSTLAKFAVTDAELRKKHGDSHVLAAVQYEFATNRPIHANLTEAITAVVTGRQAAGDVGHQAGQLLLAMKEYRHPVADLLQRLALVGRQGSLVEAERGISNMLAAWSEPSDPDAEKRLLKLRNLIRIKAGPGRETDKRIDRVAVLAELDVEHEDRLYPTPAAFPHVDVVIERAVLEDIIDLAAQPGLPLLVHAAGGMGKTVLMQGIAERLCTDGPVVLFDGFGAGSWRDPADGRHLPERTLVHLANLMAGQGLCDILLPVADTTALLRAFKRRLAQAVHTARLTRAQARISLVLDAVDHAGIAARDTATTSFAHLLLRSISVDPIDGMRVIASCRTERIALAVGDASHRSFAVPPFTDSEVRTLVARRVPNASAAEVAALQTRSGRNPRCLNTLITLGRPFDPVSLPGATGAAHDTLDVLLRKRLLDAREAARLRGAKDADIDLLLTGIALLPPPVPIDELAAAHGLVSEQVESFAADLAPLLERTPHGLMFRDEPTETLIQSTYGPSQSGRDSVVAALQERQASSSYAARALPTLLTTLRDADQLFQLAYDARVPRGSSQVSTRDIRLARVTAAIMLAGKLGRRDDLLRLLLEASLLAAGHERSDRFLYEYPDLAAVVGDPEALRRLATSSVGWPGGKHAVLALAHEFSGERDEARRHAWRAIDWNNWAAQTGRSEYFDNSRFSRKWDVLGFAYVEMLAGNDVRVAEFIARRDEGEAFANFQELFAFLDRHQRSPHRPVTRVIQRMLRCRLPSRALYISALVSLRLEPLQARRLVQALAAVPPASNGKVGGMAGMLAVVQAINLDLREEARSIFEAASVSPPSVHDFSQHHVLESSIQTTLLAAGLQAALNGRSARLIDITPHELVKLVPASSRSRGPAEFLRVLKEKLAEPKYDGIKRRSKRHRGLDNKYRSDYARVLNNRVQPLLRYAQCFAEIICPPRGRTRRDMLDSAFDRLVVDVDGASNYPYQDGKSYLVRACFGALFALADMLNELHADLATRMVQWIKMAPGLYTPQLTPIVERLSRIHSCQDAALLLAGHIETKIQLDTDVGSRVSAYGDLARAVWGVSIEEAAAYFRRALDLADAIGSDDFDRTNHLLELTGHYTGAELSPAAAHTLARIFELNMNADYGKFPWNEYARSMVPAAGKATLAILARLDDRDGARFGLSLGPALTVLVRNAKISVEAAVALLGLAPPIDTWTWNVSSFAAEAVQRLPQGRREWLFNLLLLEIDRSAQLSPSRSTIEKLRELAESSLPADSPARARIHGLLARLGPESEFQSSLSATTSVEAVATYPVDLTDPDEIDRQINSDTAERPWTSGTLSNLAKRTASPAERLGFVRAVVEATAATLDDKLFALEGPLEEWAKASAAMRDSLPELALRLATKHARELANSSVRGWSSWRRLEKSFHGNRVALVEHVVSALHSGSERVGGNGWLALAARLASEISAQAISEGLERFIAISSEKLPAEVGDGPWDTRFEVPADESEFLAGLVWARLGHTAAAMRWRAVHAVRRLVEAGRPDVVERLVGHAATHGGQPFGDMKLPFYGMHAQLWLLIALARVAKDSAAILAAHRAHFEGVAFSTSFPHVVMRAYAVDILRQVAAVLAPQERDTLLARLATANQSPFPHAPPNEYQKLRYAPRPEGSSRPDDGFDLDYDFSKNQVDRLCRVFDCPSWEIEDRISDWVRRWDREVGGMYDCPRSRHSSYDDSWSSGSVPTRDRYGGYLGWHALMLVAGELLAKRTVVSNSWEDDAWASFLGEYLLSRDDGLWLSDLSDQFPLDLTKEEDLPMPKSGERSTAREDISLLAGLLGLSDRKALSTWVPVMGHWSIGTSTTVSIQSVLASPGDAHAAAMTVLSAEEFFRWLPHDEDDIERHFGESGHTIRPWVAATRNAERRFDRHDPYGVSTALDRPFPAEWTRGLLGLTPQDSVTRLWSVKGQAAYRAEAWGAEGGKGERAWSDTGSRLSVARDVLLPLLERAGLSLLVTLVVQKYHKGVASGHADSTNAFTHRSLVLLVDMHGHLRLPQRVTTQAKV
ncbi:hypothetical protein, partial [Ideonella sp.]|uniref:hypothetical protein n=1 Tax=Ideonella sp. TaxID=1929293 RepID=UPI003BB5E948